jgi:Acyltransferase
MTGNINEKDGKEFVKLIHDLLMYSVHEILGTLDSSNFVKGFFNLLFFIPVRYFAKFFVDFDGITAEKGFPAAGRWLCNRFVSDIKVQGRENIPAKGPIMFVSNHPGAYDSFCILATCGREDLNAIISDIRFCMELPNVGPHLIYTNANVEIRMLAIRDAIKRLQNQQAFLIFPTGLIDPDPSFMDHVFEELQNWSNSVELFLRRAPDTQLVITSVSHILQKKWMKHIFLRTQHTQMTKRRMAEFIQVLNQFFIPWSIKSIPCITYGKPVSYSDLQAMEGSVQENIIRLAGIQMKGHMAVFNQPNVKK